MRALAKLFKFKDIESPWARVSLGKDEVAYRRKIKEKTWIRFPLPQQPKHKGKVIVPSRLGRVYYDKAFPSWVMWSFKDPDSLYLNINMIVMVFGELLDLPKSIDKAQVKLIVSIAESLVKELLVKRLPKLAESVVIKYHYKSDKYQDEMLPEPTHKFWLTDAQVKYLSSFDVGGR